MGNEGTHKHNVNRRLLMLSLFISHFLLFSFSQSNDDLRKELKTVTEKLGAHPDSVDLRFQKAALNMQLEQWEYAKNEYDYVLDRDPENLAGLYYRAYVNEKLGKLNFARIDYEKLLKHVPSNFEARLGLALLNQKDQHYTEALDQINQLVEAYPERAIVYVARANMERERGMYALAEYDFTQAIQLEPEQTDHLVNRVDVRILMEHFEDAKADLDLLVRKGIAKTALQDFYDRLKK